ncbi:MAG: oligosaccharide flippase family protein [Ideonella sp.]|nr:oligosaccharide flippase family protein [Ideonella sp.]
MKLGAKALRAGGWSFGGHVATQLIRFGSNLVMTRLLVPDMFGVMALALTFMFALFMFSDIGLRQIAIQDRNGDRKEFMDVIWTVQILRGLVIMAFGLGLASMIWVFADHHLVREGSAYAHPHLPWVVALLSLSAVVTGFESTRLIRLNRELSLGRTVVLELVAQITGFIVMVLWARHSPTVFALAAGAMVNAGVKTVLSHVALPGHGDSIRWDRAQVWDILRFGRWIFLGSILGFLASAGDKLLLGGLLTATDFGIYSIAIIIVAMVHEVGTKITSTVTHAALSEVHRTNPADMRRVYYKMRLPIDAVSFFCFGLLVVTGPALIGLLYDPRYAAAGLVLQILAVSFVVIGPNTSGNVYLITGQPWLQSFLISVRLVAMLVSVPVLTSLHGLAGAAWGVAIGHLATLPPIFVLKHRHGLLDIRRELIGPAVALIGFAAGTLVIAVA